MSKTVLDGGQSGTAPCPASCYYGTVLHMRVRYGCCGVPSRSGECCGEAIPVPEQVEESCEVCGGTGVVEAICDA